MKRIGNLEVEVREESGGVRLRVHDRDDDSKVIETSLRQAQVEELCALISPPTSLVGSRWRYGESPGADVWLVTFALTTRPPGSLAHEPSVSYGFLLERIDTGLPPWVVRADELTTANGWHLVTVEDKPTKGAASDDPTPTE